MDEGTRVLTEEEVIRLVGWHPRYARVVLIEHDDHHAVVLVDGNGDDSELELEYWHRDDEGQWQASSSSGHGSLRTMRSQSWNAGPFVAALGRAAPGSEVAVEYDGHSHQRQANKFGVWGFVHAAERAEELPTMAPVNLSPGRAHPDFVRERRGLG